MIEYVTIAALLLGPIFAVLVTRYIDGLRANKVRKLEIFRTLMRTRRMNLNWEHVGALNLIEVEFVNNSKVVEAWKRYLKNLGTELPPIENTALYDEAGRKRDKLLTILIYEVAQTVGIKVDQLDILEKNYFPRGWQDDDLEQRAIRRGVLNILAGNASIPIQVHQLPMQNPHSPPSEEIEN